MMEKSQNKPAEGEAFTGYMEKPQQPATQTLRKSLFSRGKQPGQPIRRGTISGFSYNEELATKEAMMQLSITARGGPKISGAGLIESPAAIENREKQIDANNGGQGSPKNAEESDDSDDFQFEEPTAEVQFGSYLERINQDFDQRKIYEEVVLRILNFYQRSPQKHPAEAEELCRKYKKAEQDPRKRTLFLDMDDLLISVSLFQHPSRQGTILDINDHTGKTIKVRKLFITPYLIDVPVCKKTVIPYKCITYLRPGLLEFLEEISQHFELILYNNGSQPYTEAVLRKLLETLNFQAEGLDIEEEEDPIIDGTTPRERRPKRMPGQPPKHYFDHILSREQCSSNEKGHEIKNLSFLVGPEANRDIKDCIIVDNQIYCYQNHLTNGLFVPNYNFSDTHDDWLPLLQHYLVDRFIKLQPGQTTLPDVRQLISKDLKFEEVFSLSTVSQIRLMMNKHLNFENSCMQQKEGEQGSSDHEQDHEDDQIDEHPISMVPTLNTMPNKSTSLKKEKQQVVENQGKDDGETTEETEKSFASKSGQKEESKMDSSQ